MLLSKLKQLWRRWRRGYPERGLEGDAYAVCGLALIAAIYGLPLWLFIMWMVKQFV